MRNVKRDIEGQRERNLRNGDPVNHRLPWSYDDILLVASQIPNRANRTWLSKALSRKEGAIDYIWYDLYRSNKSWKDEEKQGISKLREDYMNNIRKAKKVVGITLCYTPSIERTKLELEQF